MARAQYWLRNTLKVWSGYLLTAIAAIPASAIGLFLIRKGTGQQTAILVSVSFAVLGGFVAEWVVRSWSREQNRLVVLMPDFVLVVTGEPTGTTAVLLSEPTTVASPSLLLRAA